MPREVRTKGHQAEFGEIKQVIRGPFYVSFSTHERILEFCKHAEFSKHPEGKYQRDRIVRLIEMGLDAKKDAPKIKKILEAAKELRSLVRTAEQIDLIPHPPPMNVDPTWWNEKEAERLDQAREEILRVLKELGRAVEGRLEFGYS